MRDEQNRNYGDVLRHIVPEIHNALAVILGNAQLLLVGTTVNPEDRAKLKAIERGSFRIQTLVEELMQERGSPPLPSAPKSMARADASTYAPLCHRPSLFSHLSPPRLAYTSPLRAELYSPEWDSSDPRAARFPWSSRIRRSLTPSTFR